MRITTRRAAPTPARELGADPAPPNTPDDFRRTIRGAHDQWASLIRRLNLVAE